MAQNIEKHKGLLNLSHETNPYSYEELMPWFSDENRMLIRAVGYDLVYSKFNILFCTFTNNITS